MENQPIAFALRPLRIGEMLDRAVTMYVRNFVVFTALVLVVLAPITVVQSLNASAQVDQLNASISVLTHIGDSSTTAQKKETQKLATMQPALLIITGVVLLLALFLSPVGTGAVAVGVSRLYRGEPLRFTDCFLASLRKWPAMMGISFLALFMFIGWYLATVIVTILAAVPGGLLIAKALPLAVILFVLAAIVLIACVLILILMILAIAFAFFSLVIERNGVGAALGSGFKRVFNRIEFWRALLFALAILGVELGGTTISATAAILVLVVLHSTLTYILLASVVNALLSAFLTIFLVLYYFDVRIRNEGLAMPVTPTPVFIP